MNPEKPPTNSVPLSEEEKAQRRKSILEAGFGGGKAEPMPENSGLGEEIDEADMPAEEHTEAAARREELRERLLRDEDIGQSQEEPSKNDTESGSSNVGKDGRAILRKDTSKPDSEPA